MRETVTAYNSGNISSTIEEYNKEIEESLEPFNRLNEKTTVFITGKIYMILN